jgi:hypothetical protein
MSQRRRGEETMKLRERASLTAARPNAEGTLISMEYRRNSGAPQPTKLTVGPC